jgi:hypothetical protein
MAGETPVANLSNFSSLAGMMREILANFDRATNRANVKPLIRLIKTNGTVQSRAAVANIPVLQMGGGNFMLNFNLNPGDLGFIKASDRDMSLFLQSFNESPPNTYRKHSFEDSIFIPAPMHNMTINAEDESHVVLSTLDGTQRVAIWANQVKITSDTKVVIDAPLTEFT